MNALSRRLEAERARRHSRDRTGAGAPGCLGGTEGFRLGRRDRLIALRAGNGVLREPLVNRGTSRIFPAAKRASVVMPTREDGWAGVRCSRGRELSVGWTNRCSSRCLRGRVEPRGATAPRRETVGLILLDQRVLVVSKPSQAALRQLVSRLAHRKSGKAFARVGSFSFRRTSCQITWSSAELWRKSRRSRRNAAAAQPGGIRLRWLASF